MIWFRSFPMLREVTDAYLADLAAKHGARLVTFDQGITHKSVDVI